MRNCKHCSKPMTPATGKHGQPDAVCLDCFLLPAPTVVLVREVSGVLGELLVEVKAIRATLERLEQGNQLVTAPLRVE